MIKIGWKEIGITIFDYRNEVAVDFRICADKLMIIYDKKTNMSYDDISTQISVDRNNIYYKEFINLYEQLASKIEISNENKIHHFSTENNESSIRISKEDDLINFQFLGSKDYIFIDKNLDKFGIFDIYRDFILNILKYNLNKYDCENKKFISYINNREYYYGMMIDKKYDEVEALMYLLYYRQLNNKFSINNLRRDINEIEKIIDEIRCIHNEQTIYYRTQLEQKNKELQKIKDK